MSYLSVSGKLACLTCLFQEAALSYLSVSGKLACLLRLLQGSSLVSLVSVRVATLLHLFRKRFVSLICFMVAAMSYSPVSGSCLVLLVCFREAGLSSSSVAG